LPEPAVGLLSIGEEPTKGDTLTIEAHRLIAADPRIRFFGNVEGRDLMQRKVDVIVADGFAGNIALKVLEGTAKTIVTEILNAVTGSLRAKIGALIMKRDLTRIFMALDPEEYGAAYLLGVRHPVLVGHGSSGPRAVDNAIRAASRAVTSGLLEAIAEQVAEPAADAPSGPASDAPD
jgi:glycerol-3-phosphate acyltransferase PlsX